MEPEDRQRAGLRFFGAVAAGLSHELSNVHNIINELAGLQEDLAAAAAAGASANPGRIADLAGRIKAQVERGEVFNRRLHRFAHSVDAATLSFDLGDALAFTVEIASRAARLARVELGVTPPECELTVTGDPYSLTQAVHRCIEAALAAAAGERRLSVSAAASTAGPRILVSSADPLPGDIAELAGRPALAGALAAWRATLEVATATAPPYHLILQLPSNPPQGGLAAGDDIPLGG